jgi:hypothetical protein
LHRVAGSFRQEIVRVPLWIGQQTSCVARPHISDVAVSELKASDARKTGIGSKAGIANTAVPAGLLNQIF